MHSLNQFWVLSEVMEQTNAVNDDVAVFDSAWLLNKFSSLSEIVDVPPQNKVHSTQRVKQAWRLLHP